MKFLKQKPENMTGIQMIIWLILYSCAGMFSVGAASYGTWKLIEYVESRLSKKKDKESNE